MKILITNGHIWTGGENFTADILVADGKIKVVGQNLSEKYSADEVIDASGLYVFPGGIDAHTHMELPFMGTYSSDDFETGTLAALHGGTTCIIDFAIQKKGGSVKDCLREWHEKASGKAVGDYAFHLNLTDYNDEARKAIPEIISGGVTSFKVFMAYKGVLMIEDRQILEVMEDSKKYGGLVSVHAEHGDLLDFISQRLKREKKFEPKYHPIMHAPDAEIEAASRFMDLAHYIGVDAYIVHTSCGGVLTRLKARPHKNHRVWIETCPQYLLLDDSCYEEPNFGGAKYVMSPPIRKKEDQEILWKGIETGAVQVIGTDHCPFYFKGQKEMGRDDFTKIPNGAPGVENRLEVIFSEGVSKGRISMNRFVEVMSTNPARIFGLNSKGSIAAGFDADIVLFDPKERHTLSAKTHHQRADYSLYEGWNITGKVQTVLANGKVVIRDGKSDQVEKGQGRFVKRQPYKHSI